MIRQATRREGWRWTRTRPDDMQQHAEGNPESRSGPVEARVSSIARANQQASLDTDLGADTRSVLCRQDERTPTAPFVVPCSMVTWCVSQRVR